MTDRTRIATVSLAYSHEDFTGAMRAMAAGAVDVAPLITATVGLGELAAVLADLGSAGTTHAKSWSTRRIEHHERGLSAPDSRGSRVGKRLGASDLRQACWAP